LEILRFAQDDVPSVLGTNPVRFPSFFILLMVVACASAAQAQPAPSNAAKILSSNTSRPGWRRFAGTWVQSARTVTWSDLLRMHVRDGRLEVDVLPSPDVASIVRSDRRVMVEIEGSPAIWALSTAGRVWVDTQRKIPSNHFTAWASFDRGMPIGQLCPALIRITPTEKTFIGAGKINGQEVQVTCTIRGTEQGVDLLIENLGAQHQAPVLNIHATDLLNLREQKPSAVRTYLAPLLASIAGENPLRPQAGDVYRVFTDIPADAETTRKLESLLSQMESSAVEDREAASKALDALGAPGILAAIRLDRTGLSPEQNDRLDRAVESHTLLRASPDRKSDPYFLLDCLEDNDRAVRAAAKSALEKLTGKSMNYSPDLPGPQRAAAIKAAEKIVLTDTP
jgi:hypothetical protein